MYPSVKISNHKCKGSKVVVTKSKLIYIVHLFHSVDECLLKRCGDYENKNYTGTSTDADEAKKAGCHLYGDEIFSYKDQIVRDYPSLEQIRNVTDKHGSYIRLTPVMEISIVFIS